jgi:WhiB family redox-sensing transcriptional regulator
MEKAACSGMFTELFFYTSGPGHTESDVEAGLAVCHSCPVIKKCLQFAFDTDDKYSVLGGTTPAERRRMDRAAA